MHCIAPDMREEPSLTRLSAVLSDLRNAAYRAP
jgi:hypothetical protein